MKFNTNLTVAYSQISLEDLSTLSEFKSVDWNSEELNSMLCVNPNFIVIGTATSIRASFYLDVLDAEPNLDLKVWDHVNLCSINLISGLYVTGAFDTEGETLEIPMEPGIYAALICYRGLDTISPDGLSGDDSYHVFMWPVKAMIPKKVLKQWLRK